MTKAITRIVIAVFVLVMFQACEYHNLEPPDPIDATDESLFAEADAEGFVYYREGNVIPSDNNPGPHGFFKLRFNSKAVTALGPDGKLAENGRFPEGSVIVKELYLNSTLNILAVMKKAPSDGHAEEGWIWAEYHLDGRPAISLEEKGARCVFCHIQTPNRDLVRTFDAH
jgi:hypothetical protein